MKQILVEGRYDKVTTEVSREIINAVKSGKKRLQTRIALFQRTFVDISVYIHYKENIPQPQVYGGAYIDPKQIRKTYKDKRIVLHVEVDEDMSTRLEDMAFLVGEVKNIVRHEIEHITQYKFPDRQRKFFFSSKRSYPENLTYGQYLLEPYEVEAHIRGLYKKAKTIRHRDGLNYTMQEWFDYMDNVLEPEEAKAVKKAWIDYAKIHLPKSHLRTYGYDDNLSVGNLVESRTIGFAYKKPDVRCVINIEAPQAGNIRFKLMDILDDMNVEYNSVKGSDSNYRLDLNIRDADEIETIKSDLYLKLMLNNINIGFVNTYFP